MDFNSFKIIPSTLNKGFGFCIYGLLTDELKSFASEFKLDIEETDKYINFYPTKNTNFNRFYNEKTFKFMDGFSPNLNKYLHIGHFSNLVLAKAYQSLGVSESYISILGDTLSGDVNKHDSLKKFNEYCILFNYKIDKIYFASEMKCNEEIFYDGKDEYEGTKIVNLGDEKAVVIKKDGTTSYTYQDIALASRLNDSTLYLTGYEQENHFNALKKLFPHINHIGLGLVKFKSSKLGTIGKMSSSLGNVVFLSDVMTELMGEFDNDAKLCYNIFAGYILKANPKSDKIFDLDTIKNPKNSAGLYLSYTMARLKSAGVNFEPKDAFNKQELSFNYIKSKSLLNPMFLFNSLIDLSKEINKLYVTHHIEGNKNNELMFSLLLSDLALGMNKLGLFEIDKV